MGNKEMQQPLMSIFVFAYNQAKYIRQCLDGIVMQKTNFPIEVIVHDDASTDDTQSIIRDYENKYPDIIKPTYETENKFSQGIYFMYDMYMQSQGKYIAFCDGDDYWTDPYKLQKQVDFLEANEDFSICFHRTKLFKQNEGIFVDDYYEDVPDITDINKLSDGPYIQFATVVIRKISSVFDTLGQYKPYNGDYFLEMLNAKYGKIKKLPDVMAVYRIHDGGIWSLKSVEEKRGRWLNLLDTLMIVLKEDDKVLDNLKKQYSMNAIGG